MRKINWKNVVITLLTVSNLLLVGNIVTDNEATQTGDEGYDKVALLETLNSNQKELIEELQADKKELESNANHWYNQYQLQLEEVNHYKGLIDEIEI